MTRELAALLVLFMSTPALAKYVCPPGSFVVHAAGESPEPLRSGLTLELGTGRAELSGLCAAAAAGRFHRSTGRWLNQVRVRWPACGAVRRAALRARFVPDALYCTRLVGTLRLGGRRFPVVADRVPACGNGLRESGEQCDGSDSAAFGTCCAPDCSVKAGCPVQCDRDHFPCGDQDICVHTCGSGGVCKARAEVDCGGGPVCGCDSATTYADRCAAFDAGTGVVHAGACQPAAPPRYGY